MLLFITLICAISFVQGFLLDGNNSQSLGGGNPQYMTLTSFYDQKRQIDYRIDQVQRDADNKLNILASQLQQRFAALESKLQTQGGGNTDSKVQLELKYKELEQNYTDLQQKYATLDSKYHSLLTELDSLLGTIETKHTAQELEIDSVRNQTMELASQFTSIEQFKDIKGLQDYHSLQQKVVSLDKQTRVLEQKELARSQDFLALYNVTLATKSMISNLDSKTTKTIGKLDNNINVTSEHSHLVEGKLMRYASLWNSTTSVIENKLEKATEKVGFTAFFTSSTYYRKNTILVFNDVKYSYGIGNMDIYKNNGTFIIEKEGLYLLSASMTSYTALAKYFIYLNGNEISATFIGVFTGPKEHTAAASMVLELKVGDQIWVQSDNSEMIYLYGGSFSRFMVAKIK